VHFIDVKSTLYLPNVTVIGEDKIKL